MAPRSSRSTKNKKTRIPQEEVSFLFDKLEAEERSEEAWSDMIAAPPDEGLDHREVEEHLLRRPHEHDASLRRWKHFGK
ncbi:MAG: hypothetical protein AUJ52_04915 [Elusimicrobia bacterium CG1_02_63_36]|nr:MAG: hypothetical protein AUJ52_04915 [Elusimicrobia bacterium CG1_02_63_36]PIP82755.1 MAG: hypothetical protein COR54_13450 [Elusimicrobia bacterium CG22_combo_CG10-13_8_21_14_all_63_91]PJA14985.1 MAG: hypothetical protein COX66_11165 [Elusimicrobia bacterium CG_4_10_14_0_2_um_filter_63_34]PJB23755.1 MAG: hypothetical protein CO113_16705 [Elusimicrobia bacterium CG_4_9_14_3_um_filter_62_55]